MPTELMRSLPAHTGGCFALAFDRGGTRLATCGADKTVKLWDSSGHHINTLHVGFSHPHCKHAQRLGVTLCLPEALNAAPSVRNPPS